MGHYCYECGEKLIGGITPTTCNCIIEKLLQVTIS